VKVYKIELSYTIGLCEEREGNEEQKEDKD
jgi:hypothetical protein